MSQIKVSNLTFSYDTTYDNIFENTSFEIDTDWKLGFIGRNGKGKTTFLKLLMRQYEYKGSISASVSFDYFPFMVQNMEVNTLELMKEMIAPYQKWEKLMEEYIKDNTAESLENYGEILDLYLSNDGYNIEDYIRIELSKLKVDESVLTRNFSSLSNGERTKVMLIALFLKKNNFLLIDEPTNHLDIQGRELLAEYLNDKSSFILISHDRTFLDACIDHVLSINRNTIDILKGNYSTWKYEKDLEDNYEKEKNAKLKKEIAHLEEAKERTANWSNSVESEKIGTHAADRGRIGHLAAKMMKRSKAIEKRQNTSIEEKEKLLKNIEECKDLKINIMEVKKRKMLEVIDLTIAYGNKTICEQINFTVNQGDRVVLKGKNGGGKTSVLKAILGDIELGGGSIWRQNNLKISYISQDTSYLKGSLIEFANQNHIDFTLFLTVLQQLDFPRKQFEKEIQHFSEGQRKKVLIAKSLVEPSHLFIWDEPLNYIDVLSRVQIEKLILSNKPTMLFIEHDKMFVDNIATKIIEVKN